MRAELAEGTPDLPAEAWVQRGALSFRPVSPGEPSPKRAPRTVLSPVLGLEPGKTLPLGDTSFGAAVAAALPYPALAPRLTARQYASLYAELDLWPARSGAILGRYQVRSDGARAALDAYWGTVHAVWPAARAAFEADRASYTALLRAQRA